MEQTIVRKPLLSASLGSKRVTSVVREIIFQPKQQTGRHRHPCPVLGYFAEVTADTGDRGRTKHELPQGMAFYEPASTVGLAF